MLMLYYTIIRPISWPIVVGSVKFHCHIPYQGDSQYHLKGNKACNSLRRDSMWLTVALTAHTHPPITLTIRCQWTSNCPPLSITHTCTRTRSHVHYILLPVHIVARWLANSFPPSLPHSLTHLWAIPGWLTHSLAHNNIHTPGKDHALCINLDQP